jgi:hypothetical protein
MDKNEKAKAVIDAVQKTAAELRAEGKANMADRTLSAFKDVPVGSLAKFYDILQQFETKAAALESMGASA